MKISRHHPERHRIGWLRAAVLGANDGIVSTASLVVGVAAASASHGNILLTGIAGLAAIYVTRGLAQQVQQRCSDRH